MRGALGILAVVLTSISLGCGPSATGGGDAGGDGAGCVNLECAQVTCPGGGTTRLVGTIRAPTLDAPDPVPGVTVYVPNATVEPFTPGAECTTCNAPLSGSPLVEATTATDGSFSIDNVPPGASIPVVIQLGRWRRQVTLPIEACVDNPLPPDLAHLPRTQAQGDIPKMALVTGQIDPLECTIAKLIDPGEVTAPDGAGRVHLYRRNGSDLATPVPSRDALLADLATLLQYDAILLPCPSHEVYTAQEAENLRTYADRGGRIFNTHGGGFWMFEPSDLYGGIVQFNNQPDPDVSEGIVNTSFAKGMQFADWLQIIGTTTTYARIPMGQPQWFVDSVTGPAQAWVTTEGPATVQQLTFNTPLSAAPEARCGRVLFSNFHAGSSLGTGIYPGTCQSGPLSPEEQIIEFMIFDVTACVRPDVVE